MRKNLLHLHKLKRKESNKYYYLNAPKSGTLFLERRKNRFSQNGYNNRFDENFLLKVQKIGQYFMASLKHLNSQWACLESWFARTPN